MRYVLSFTVSALMLLASSAMSQPIESGIELGVKGGLNLATMSGDLTSWPKTIRESDFAEAVPGYSDDFENSSRTFPAFGLFAALHVNEAFAVQVEMRYAKKGVEGAGAGVFPLGATTATYEASQKLNLSYLEIPVLLKYKIPLQGSIQPALYFGPFLAFKMSAKSEEELRLLVEEVDTTWSVTGSGEPEISNIKSTDFGLALGGDVGIKVGGARLYVDVRYELGMSSQFEDVDPASYPEFDIEEPYPTEYPMADLDTGEKCDLKNRALSIMVGVAFQLR